MYFIPGLTTHAINLYIAHKQKKNDNFKLKYNAFKNYNIIYDNNRGDYTATQYTQIPPAPEVASLMKY